MSKPEYDKTNVRENRINVHLVFCLSKNFTHAVTVLPIVLFLNIRMEYFIKIEYNFYHLLDAI